MSKPITKSQDNTSSGQPNLQTAPPALRPIFTVEAAQVLQQTEGAARDRLFDGRLRSALGWKLAERRCFEGEGF